MVPPRHQSSTTRPNILCHSEEPMGEHWFHCGGRRPCGDYSSREESHKATRPLNGRGQLKVSATLLAVDIGSLSLVVLGRFSDRWMKGEKACGARPTVEAEMASGRASSAVCLSLALSRRHGNRWAKAHPTKVDRRGLIVVHRRDRRVIRKPCIRSSVSVSSRRIGDENEIESRRS